jgi:hypothetical protein
VFNVECDFGEMTVFCAVVHHDFLFGGAGGNTPPIVTCNAKLLYSLTKP